MSGLRGFLYVVKAGAQGRFLGALAVIPRTALKAHDHCVISNEMRRGAGCDQARIGSVGANVAQRFGGVDACALASGLYCRA